MTRSLLRRRGWAVALCGCVSAWGCTGQSRSMGYDAVAFENLDPAQVDTHPPPCASGQAHPNICCRGGAATAGECGSWPNEPFHPCEPGWQTFPDAARCCSVTEPSQCGAPAASKPPPACLLLCGPGWSDPGTSSGLCCRTGADSEPECTQPMGTGFSDGIPSCPSGYVALGPRTCCEAQGDGSGPCFTFLEAQPDTCPPGFGVDPQQPGQCCQTQPGGALTCNPLPVGLPVCPAGYAIVPGQTGQCCRPAPGGQTYCVSAGPESASPCPTGYHGALFGACCVVTGDGVEICYANSAPRADSRCPAGLFESGTDLCCRLFMDGRASCYRMSPPGQPPQGASDVLCPAPCPKGYSEAPGAPGVCCADGASGTVCFSRVTGVVGTPK